MKYFYSFFSAPFCSIVFVAGRKGLLQTYLYQNKEEADSFFMPGIVRDDYGLRDIRCQFEEYFSGRRTKFDFDLDMQGTEFQQKVWHTLCNIPFGETRSYQQIGAQIGNSKAARAVGMANSKNPLPVIIPCHRVIAADGSLGGFSYGLVLKKKFLDFERRQKQTKSLENKPSSAEVFSKEI